jgi:hypothetical protein
MMRGLATSATLALMAACQSEAPRPGNGQGAPAPPANVSAPAANEAIADAPQSDAALAAMSPGRRRAYDRGLADCRAGRYQPANHPEAYRIGCAAAQDEGPR